MKIETLNDLEKANLILALKLGLITWFQYFEKWRVTEWNEE